MTRRLRRQRFATTSGSTSGAILGSLVFPPAVATRVSTGKAGRRVTRWDLQRALRIPCHRDSVVETLCVSVAKACLTSVCSGHGLPGDRLSIAEEAAGWSFRSQRGEPDDGVGAFLHGPRRAGATHVGAHPAWARAVHEHARAACSCGELSRESIERGLGHRIRGGVSAHRRKLASLRRHVDDAAVAASNHSGHERLGHCHRAQDVRLERVAQVVGLEIDDADPLVQKNRGVVHERAHIDPALSQLRRQRADALRTGHVELSGADRAGRREARGRRFGLRQVPGGENDPMSQLRQLPAHFESDAAIASGDDGGARYAHDFEIG